MKKVTRMKKLKVKLLEDYKLYRKNCEYVLDGDLILLSGINGSGKSQLLKIIANNLNKKIARNVHQSSNDEDFVPIENIIMLSFRDNIDLGNDFGAYSINVKLSNSDHAWKFYYQSIKYKEHNSWNNAKLKQSFYNGDILFYNGGKNPAWRSILEIITLLKKNYQDDKLFTLSEEEFKRLIPNNFIWRNENDIIQQVGNLFYLACCDRANQQIECSKTGKIFDNSTWLQSAPWTILNKLFSELNFKYRFKDDYLFDTPDMEENPKLRLNSDIRNLNDLSDGEKAILKLALISLDEEISKDIMMLPIPNRLLDYVSTDTSNYCFVEIETLLDEEFLKNNSKAKRGEKAIQIYKIKDSDKSIFWKDLLNADKSVFKDFEPLFSTVENIFKSKD